MADPDRILLHFGPYHPPRCRVGEVLTCAVRGRVKVVGFSSGRIPWPVTFVGNRGPSLIVCGGLLRAVHRESRPAVADWWGVRVLTVSIWRRALKNPEYRARLVNAKRLANLRAANRRRLRTRPRRVPLWKPEWDVLLGSEPDRKLAERLGVNRQLVFSRRKLLGIAGTRPRPAHRVRRWKPWEDALLGTGPDREIAERLGCGLRAVFFRRQKLGVPAFRQRLGPRVPRQQIRALRFRRDLTEQDAVSLPMVGVVANDRDSIVPVQDGRCCPSCEPCVLQHLVT